MGKFKILIVDDDVNLAFVLQQRLESEGFEVENANSVTAGYLIYRSFKPDLVLTDISMGDESGFDLMHRIRNDTPRIKTIYMTGDLSRHLSALEQERNQHHAMFLSKPFSERNLLDSISARVQGRDQIAA
ncbi:MAG: two-component system, OmpR family, response regulator CpxR [Candidatus Binatota bacterium]|jgi:DNA-binding NtrC family response regulator|nr:two-component system, OmpR family, response regulator CpxR [Candidatus Binatota bacterium]